MSTIPLPTPPADAADAGRIEDPNMPLKLLLARERILQRFRPVLHDYGLTEQQWRIVRALLQTGPIEQRQLEELCGFSSASLAGILARMQTQGWVVRERLANDQRRVRVGVTAKSRALAARIRPAITDTYRRIEARAGRERMAQLVRVLDEVIAALDEPADGERVDQAGD